MLQLAPRGEIAVPILKLEAPRAPHVKRHIRPCVVSLTSAYGLILTTRSSRWYFAGGIPSYRIG